MLLTAHAFVSATSGVRPLYDRVAATVCTKCCRPRGALSPLLAFTLRPQIAQGPPTSPTSRHGMGPMRATSWPHTGLASGRKWASYGAPANAHTFACASGSPGTAPRHHAVCSHCCRSLPAAASVFLATHACTRRSPPMLSSSRRDAGRRAPRSDK